jgi:hypothetical protein
MKRTLLKALGVGLALTTVATSVFAAAVVSGPAPLASTGGARDDGGVAARSEVARDIPIVNWSAPQLFNPEVGVSGNLPGFAAAGISGKASLILSTFIPIAPCRLVDTRGAFSPVYAGGPFSAGQTRVYRASGN